MHLGVLCSVTTSFPVLNHKLSQQVTLSANIIRYEYHFKEVLLSTADSCNIHFTLEKVNIIVGRIV